MADQLKNIITVDLVVGANPPVAHGLTIAGRGRIPDIVAPDQGGLSITADATNLTITNNTGAAVTARIFVQFWHTYERALGGVQNTTLTPQPFFLQGASSTGAGLTLGQAYKNGAASPQAIAIDTTRGPVQIRDIAVPAGQTLFQVTNSTGATNYFRVDGDGAVAGQRFAYFNAGLSITAPASTGGLGGLFALSVTGAAHTLLTASTESTSIRFNLDQTHQFATGNFALQRAIRIDPERLSAVAASVIDAATTVSIEGPPQNAGNITMTRSYALWVRAGETRVVGLQAGTDINSNPQAAMYTQASTFIIEASGTTNAFGDLASLTVRTGSPSTAGGYSGSINLNSGNGAAGDANIAGGNAGAVTVQAGNGGNSTSFWGPGNGGGLNLVAGSGGSDNAGAGNGLAGTVLLSGGNGGAANGGGITAGAGGLVTIAGGNAGGIAGGATGNAGGAVSIGGGNGSGTGTGGGVTINAGPGGGGGIIGTVSVATTNVGPVQICGPAGTLTFFQAGVPVVRQTGPSAVITNNVTAGGVDSTIANFTDLVTYANDAATIRNDIYQLARGLKFVSDAMLAYGLIT